mgnify:FL=1
MLLIFSYILGITLSLFGIGGVLMINGIQIPILFLILSGISSFIIVCSNTRNSPERKATALAILGGGMFAPFYFAIPAFVIGYFMLTEVPPK